MTYKRTKITIIMLFSVFSILMNLFFDHNDAIYNYVGLLFFILILLMGLWFHDFVVYGALILSSFHILYHVFNDQNQIVKASIESILLTAIAIFIYVIQHIRSKELERYQRLIDATRIGTWEWNIIRDKVVYNRRWYEILGYVKEDFSKDNKPIFQDFTHPDDIDLSNKTLEKLLSGDLEYYDIKIRMKHKDGHWAWIRDQGKVTKRMSNGKPWIISGSHADITSDVESQEYINYQNERFNQIVNHSPDIIYELDLDLNIISIHGEFAKMFDVEHLIGKRVDTFAAGKNNSENHLAMSKKALEGELVTYEWSDRFGGEKFYFESSLSRIENHNHEVVGVVGIARNITAQKLVELDKEQQKYMLKYIVETSTNSIAIFDNQMNYIFVSQKFKDENNVSDADIIGKNHYEMFSDIPERFREIHRKALQGEAFSSERDSLVRQDGHIEWMRWDCRPWYERQGEVGGIVLSTYNLDEQMRLENELKLFANQLSEQRNALDATLKSIGEALVATDNEGCITMMNKQAEIITGISINEALGKPFDQVIMISDKNNKPENGKIIRQVLLTQKRIENEAERFLTNRSGIVYPIEKTTAPILNNNHEAIGVVVVIRDITEKYKRQQEIEHLSMHDFLTNLHNRRYFVEELNKLDQEIYYPLGLLMIDLNGLKLFNDAYGHDIGDLALIKVASTLSRVFDDGEVVARIGGDEFAVIIHNTTTEYIESKKMEIAEQLSGVTIENIALTIAIGYELKHEKQQDTEEILRIAENYMYRNKLTAGHSFRNHAIKAILQTLTDKYEAERIHSFKVSEYVSKIGHALGLKQDDIKELELAGLYHDIGKISVPDAILDKPGRLTDEEYEKIKLHTEVGYQILKAADEYSNLAEYALSHHERWDGKGYPRGLKEKGIPLFSRIIAVADSYEAMTADRVYRKRLTDVEAVNEIKKCAGTQFDPKIAKVFVEKVLNKSWK